MNWILLSIVGSLSNAHCSPSNGDTITTHYLWQAYGSVAVANNLLGCMSQGVKEGFAIEPMKMRF